VDQGLLVATDLDGSLLDEEGYSWAEAREALAALAARGVPLVLASSKTRAEMEPIRRALGLVSPLIVENGGALVIPEEGLGRAATRERARALVREAPGAKLEDGAVVLVLGTPRAALVRELAALAAETGASVRGFAQLGAGDVARLTGLPPASAVQALAREYDEPFVLEDEGLEGRIAEAAGRRRLRVSRGGRFFHLTGPTDKGQAFRVLVGLLEAAGERIRTIALGDSPNDLPLLQAVERPILIPRPGGRLDEVLAAALPEAECAPATGPVGWNAAVLTLLAGGRLPTAASVGVGGGVA